MEKKDEVEEFKNTEIALFKIIDTSEEKSRSFASIYHIMGMVFLCILVLMHHQISIVFKSLTTNKKLSFEEFTKLDLETTAVWINAKS